MEVRKPSSLVRTSAEGGTFAAAAMVASQIAEAQFPGTQGAGLLAASLVGALGAWLASVSRNLVNSDKVPSWVKILAGA